MLSSPPPNFTSLGPRGDLRVDHEIPTSRKHDAASLLSACTSPADLHRDDEA